MKKSDATLQKISEKIHTALQNPSCFQKQSWATASETKSGFNNKGSSRVTFGVGFFFPLDWEKHSQCEAADNNSLPFPVLTRPDFACCYLTWRKSQQRESGLKGSTGSPVLKRRSCEATAAKRLPRRQRQSRPAIYRVLLCSRASPGPTRGARFNTALKLTLACHRVLPW